jgi:2-polyprenyl-3-methyl-5-hydroxy-6-metoxy-1,4-benzoquinol methylase
MAKVHYTHCPLCLSSKINPLLTVRDHSVSREEFVVWKCTDCTLKFTQDVPDEASIGAYYRSEDYISHSNTSRGLVNRLYQRVRNHTLNGKAALIRDHTVSRGRILDLGAGTGAFLATMKNKGWQATGIEPDEGARRVAKETFHIDLSDTGQLEKLEEGSFDAITLWHVLEHVHQLHPYVERLRGLLKPGGKLFVAVPNYNSLDHSIYKLYWAAYDVPRHLYHFTPRAMKTLMKRHKMTIEEKKPMWFDSFYISLLSSRYKNGKESWLGAGWNGLRSNITALFNKDRCSSLIYIIKKDQ